ncbi:SPOSA6832_02426 [Sporobolomyces salmonicolor]|uniref:3-hydroxyisobutyrate dehydrogenase n=1 Tax=Sporidiobolus salmonicolor TaxID=5005 RepID=A0A0D6EMC2_SPOSA|nr:SPOSA6832_02426 [Sporobolomyces salmonicolor]
MGRGMAAQLLNKTFAGTSGVYAYDPDKPRPAFVVYDAHPPAVSAFLTEHTRAYAGRDILPASSPAGVARLASTIITMLPSSPQVQEVYLGENGLKEGLEGMSDERRQETLFVDCTTLDQGVAKEVAAQVRELGAEMVDAPVSGGVVGAEKGTLSFMVGGPEEAYVTHFASLCLIRYRLVSLNRFKRAQPYLARMGSRYIHCGDSGNGLAAKICNKEAMLLGKSLGLSPELLASILNTSTGKCWSSEINNPAPGATPMTPTPADRAYSGGSVGVGGSADSLYGQPSFLSKLMAKDLGLAISASRDAGVPLPVGSLTSTLYHKLSAHEEYGARDFSVVYEYLREGMDGGVAKKLAGKATKK